MTYSTQIETYTVSKANGKTAHITHINSDCGLIEIRQAIMDQNGEIAHYSIENYISGTKTEFKTKKQSDGSQVCIKTIFDANDVMRSQGPIDESGLYHGTVRVFKGHKIRIEQYTHGQKTDDLTHPIRNKILKFLCLQSVFGHKFSSCNHIIHDEPYISKLYKMCKNLQQIEK